MTVKTHWYTNRTSYINDIFLFMNPDISLLYLTPPFPLSLPFKIYIFLKIGYTEPIKPAERPSAAEGGPRC